MIAYADPYTTVYHGDSRKVLAELPKDSVDVVVTSPPYWSLRSYAGLEPLLFGGDAECQHEWVDGKDAPVNHGGRAGASAKVGATKAGIQRQDGMWPNHTGEVPFINIFCRLCGAWLGHYGLEAHPDLYIAHSMEFLDAIWRVLKPTGLVFWNVDDSRVGSNNGSNDYRAKGASLSQNALKYQGQKTGRVPGLRPTSLALIPQRFVIAAQERGWIIESVIIWNKPDAMPESVKRRPTDSHEYIFMLAKSNKWLFYQDAVREPHKAESLARYQRNSSYDQPRVETPPYAMQQGPRGHGVPKYDGSDPTLAGNGSGFVGHSGYTKANGEPLVNEAGRNIRSVWTFPTQAGPTGPDGERHFAGYPEELVERCLLAGSKEGDLVLDPFCGQGTTLRVAKRLARQSIGIEASSEYLAIIKHSLRSVEAGSRALF